MNSENMKDCLVELKNEIHAFFAKHQEDDNEEFGIASTTWLAGLEQRIDDKIQTL